MTDPVLLSEFWDVLWGMMVIFFIFIPIVLIWVFALVDLFRRKGMAPLSRVIWLLVIVALPILGPMTYLLVRPRAGEIEYR